jgi:hypothetical protein
MTLETRIGRGAGRPRNHIHWLAARFSALGVGEPVAARHRHRPRRVDVLLNGRPAALLDKPTTPLWATR